MPSLKEFKDSLGSKINLYGFNKTYRILLLLKMLQLVDDNGKVSFNGLCDEMKNFYKQRDNKGLKAETYDSEIQKKIDCLTGEIVAKVIRVDALRVLKSKGFVIEENISAEIVLCFARDLWDEIKIEDKSSIIELLGQKLDLYYKTYLGDDDNMEKLKKNIDKIMNEYKHASEHEQFEKHSLGNLLRNEIPDLIMNLPIIDKERYYAKGTIGAGGWTKTPWIAILDKKIKAEMQEGIYIVYLFSSDLDRIYLTLNQGVANYSKSHSKKETVQYLEETANKIRKYFDSSKAILDNNIVLNGTTNADLYEKGTIAYIEYKKHQLPSKEKLLSDLSYFIEVYKSFADNEEVEEIREVEVEEPVQNTIQANLSNSEIIKHIEEFIESKGFTYDGDLIKNFYLALKSKPFVILAGTSGTGKSKLVKLFAEALGATSQNGRYKLVPVKPDWSDSTDLLGYRDLHGKFHPGLLTSFIEKALDERDKPFFLCLDEMNLARVEYYFSDILSVMETRIKVGEGIITDKLIAEELFGDDREAKQKYGDIYIPENLYIIGTVNMDETTFPFSKKVLDRASTIEFSHVNLAMNFSENKSIEPIGASNDFIKSQFLLLDDCKEHVGVLHSTITTLMQINNVLQKANLQFGYRIRDEICYYMIYNEINKLMDYNKAMDYEILQKILPRIQGSGMSIKRLLIDLFKICINDNLDQFNYDNVGVNEDMLDYINRQNNMPYVKSASKIAFMMRRFEEDGFTSYWM